MSRRSRKRVQTVSLIAFLVALTLLALFSKWPLWANLLLAALWVVLAIALIIVERKCHHPITITSAQLFATSGSDFEHEIADLYRDLGYLVDERGVDLVVTDRTGRRHIIQCKNLNKPVGPDVVRDLAGNISGKNVASGILVTRTVSQAAWDEAKHRPKIQIVDKFAIERMLRRARPIETQPADLISQTTSQKETASTQPSLQSPHQHTIQWLLVGLGVAGVLAICGFAALAGVLWLPSVIKPMLSASTGDQAAPAQNDNKLQVKLVSSNISTEIPRASQSPLRPAAGDNGRFIVVTVRIINKSDDALEFVPSSYVLTSAGYQFTPDPFASTASQGNSVFYCSPLPSESASNRTIAFDIPVDIAMKSATLIVYGDAAHTIKASVLVQ